MTSTIDLNDYLLDEKALAELRTKTGDEILCMFRKKSAQANQFLCVYGQNGIAFGTITCNNTGESLLAPYVIENSIILKCEHTSLVDLGDYIRRPKALKTTDGWLVTGIHRSIDSILNTVSFLVITEKNYKVSSNWYSEGLHPFLFNPHYHEIVGY